MKLLISAVLIALALSASAEKARFDNYRLYRVDVDTRDQLSVLRQLSESSDSYDFFDEPSAIESKVEVLIAPHKFADFAELAERFNINFEILHNNWQELIDAESAPSKAPKNVNWTAYHRYQVIADWVDSLAREFPNWVTVENIGTSLEGRTLKLAKVSKQAGNRAIFIEANIHAREWISGATATYTLNELLRSTDPAIQAMSQTVDWHILVSANPDGYEYTHTTNRNWRKTRSVASALCFGVDGNRNFAYNWLVADETGNLGASTNPCSDTYAGATPFSEPETAAVEAYLARNYASFDIYLSYHSYGHYLLYPMGNTQVQVPNQAEHAAIGTAAGNALFGVNGIRYLVGNSRTALYATSGTSVDHAYGQYRIPIGYTYEMRGNGVYGNHGFVLPPQWIIPNCQEVMASLVAMVASARTYGYLG